MMEGRRNLCEVKKLFKKGRKGKMEPCMLFESTSCYSDGRLMKKFFHLIVESGWCLEYENEPKTLAQTVHRLGDPT